MSQTKLLMIMQLKHGHHAEKMRFKPYFSLDDADMQDILALPERQMKGALHMSDYDMVYWGYMDYDITVRDVFKQFKKERPKSFLGTSLSVSDVIVTIDEENVQAFYVDEAAFHSLDNRFFYGLEIKVGCGHRNPIFQAAVRDMLGYVAFDRAGNYIGAWFVPRGEHFQMLLKRKANNGILTHPVSLDALMDFLCLPPTQIWFLGYLKHEGWKYGREKKMHRC